MKGFSKLKPSSKKFSLPANAKQAQKDLEEYYTNTANATFDRCLAFCCRNQQFLEAYAELHKRTEPSFPAKLSAMGYCKLFGLPLDGSTNEDIRDLRMFEDWIKVNVFPEWLKRWG